MAKTGTLVKKKGDPSNIFKDLKILHVPPLKANFFIVMQYRR
jgi:hypothetical protein